MLIKAARLLFTQQHAHLLRDSAVVNAVAAAACRSGGRIDSGLSSFLMGSAVASLAPAEGLHPLLQRLSWSLFLQAALILGVWSTGAAARSNTQPMKAQTGPAIFSGLLPILVSFSFGCAGSVLGTLTGASLVGSLFPASEVWPVAAACLAASYVGGTANFFETASVLGAAGAGPVARTLRLIAGADIAAMVLYFSVLLRLRSHVLRHPKGALSFLAPEPASTAATSSMLLAEAPAVALPSAAGEKPAPAALSVSLALGIACMASRVQASLTALPGLAVLASVLSAVALERSAAFRRLLAGPLPLARATDYALATFYACIGLGCRVQEVGAVGLPVVLLMATTLVVHLAVVLGCSWAWNSAGLRRITVDTAVIASNACVGGAATAASMAAGMPGADPALPLLGSIAGLLGYALGTPLGLALARYLAPR